MTAIERAVVFFNYLPEANRCLIHEALFIAFKMYHFGPSFIRNLGGPSNGKDVAPMVYDWITKQTSTNDLQMLAKIINLYNTKNGLICFDTIKKQFFQRT